MKQSLAIASRPVLFSKHGVIYQTNACENALYVQMTLIYHITTMQEIERAARVGKYLPANFEADGFIHCAYSNQLRSVAEAKFRGKADLALVEIDISRLDRPIVEGDATFPHIYGPLPMEAGTAVRYISIPESGSFQLPCNVDV